MSRNKPKIKSRKQFKELYIEYGASYIAREYDMSRTTVWRIAKEMGMHGKVGRPSKTHFEDDDD